MKKTILRNSKGDEVAAIFVEEKSSRWRIVSKTEPDFKRTFATEKEAFGVWHAMFNAQTGTAIIIPSPLYHASLHHQLRLFQCHRKSDKHRSRCIVGRSFRRGILQSVSPIEFSPSHGTCYSLLHQRWLTKNWEKGGGYP
jgi:hypothetical protein